MSTTGAQDGTESGSGNRGTATFLLGAVGLLAALLTALATANGGIDRIERNDRWTLFAGVVCVLIAIAAGALFMALSPTGTTPTPKTRRAAAARTNPRSALIRRALTWVYQLIQRNINLRTLLLTGVLALAIGLITVAYAAVEHVAGRPSITAAVTADGKLGVLVAGDVTVSDISASTHLEMRVDALIPGQIKGANTLVPRAIYAASFGPNSSGDVTHAYQVILPQHTYEVLIQAWTGKYGSCFNNQIPRKAAGIPSSNDLGCLRLKLPPALTAGP